MEIEAIPITRKGREDELRKAFRVLPDWMQILLLGMAWGSAMKQPTGSETSHDDKKVSA